MWALPQGEPVPSSPGGSCGISAVTHGVLLQTQSYCQILWKLHSGIVSCRSFASQVKLVLFASSSGEACNPGQETFLPIKQD